MLLYTLNCIVMRHLFTVSCLNTPSHTHSLINCYKHARPSAALALLRTRRPATILAIVFLKCTLPVSDYFSLVPRPLLPRKKGPGIHCSRMCEIIARMYGKGPVNVSVNGLSHMARS